MNNFAKDAFARLCVFATWPEKSSRKDANVELLRSSLRIVGHTFHDERALTTPKTLLGKLAAKAPLPHSGPLPMGEEPQIIPACGQTRATEASDYLSPARARRRL